MPLTVTRPSLPPLTEFIPYLEDIWERRILTNGGYYHQNFEKALREYLDINYLSVFTNGTLPLLTALQCLRITGEVITTPYSFAATAHVIEWNGLTPVFADVDEYANISPDKLEQAITPKTSAVIAVHCYGNPCKIHEIQKIADRYGLKVIYDAAHAFAVQYAGKSILEYGDLATLSFHATKTFNTLEGGALISRDEPTKNRIDNLKNFGFVDETKIIMAGINGKMDEMRAALGILQLKYINSEIEKRKKAAHMYREQLKNIPAVRYFDDIEDVRHNYTYFPIFINEKIRDVLYEKLRENDIYARRYFYPLINEFLPYKNLPSANNNNLPNALKISREVICLPMHAQLNEDDIERVVSVIKKNV